jgi:hypothetical protein
MTEKKSVFTINYKLTYDSENREHVGLMLGIHNFLERYMYELKEYGVLSERTIDVLIDLPADYKKKDPNEKIDMLVLKLDD